MDRRWRWWCILWPLSIFDQTFLFSSSKIKVKACTTAQERAYNVVLKKGKQHWTNPPRLTCTIDQPVDSVKRVAVRTSPSCVDQSTRPGRLVRPHIRLRGKHHIRPQLCGTTTGSHSKRRWPFPSLTRFGPHKHASPKLISLTGQVTQHVLQHGIVTRTLNWAWGPNKSQEHPKSCHCLHVGCECRKVVPDSDTISFEYEVYHVKNLSCFKKCKIHQNCLLKQTRQTGRSTQEKTQPSVFEMDSVCSAGISLYLKILWWTETFERKSLHSHFLTVDTFWITDSHLRCSLLLWLPLLKTRSKTSLRIQQFPLIITSDKPESPWENARPYKPNKSLRATSITWHFPVYQPRVPAKDCFAIMITLRAYRWCRGSRARASMRGRKENRYAASPTPRRVVTCAPGARCTCIPVCACTCARLGLRIRTTTCTTRAITIPRAAPVTFAEPGRAKIKHRSRSRSACARQIKMATAFPSRRHGLLIWLATSLRIQPLRREGACVHDHHCTIAVLEERTSPLRVLLAIQVLC